MKHVDPPRLRQVAYADFSEFFSQDRRVPGGWDPEKKAPFPFLGTNTLFCRNCGQFVPANQASNHDKWHQGQNFESMYRRKTNAPPTSPIIRNRVYGRRVA